MTSNFNIIDQERTNQSIDGVHYGRNVRILARVGDRLLIWVPGQNYWGGTGQAQVYHASRLYAHYPHRGGALLTEGGRLTIARIKLLARQIDDRFGQGFHALLDPAKTVVVGET